MITAQKQVPWLFQTSLSDYALQPITCSRKEDGRDHLKASVPLIRRKPIRDPSIKVLRTCRLDNLND